MTTSSSYANGKWLATFKMPADKARFGAFDALGDKSEADVKAIVESLAAEKPAAGTTPAKVGDMYSSWMDEAAIEARGIAPLQPVPGPDRRRHRHGRRARADGHHRFRGALRHRHRGRSAGSDQLRGLGRPGRHRACPTATTTSGRMPSFEKYRAAYKAYVTKIFELLGDAGAGGVRRHGDRARDEDRAGALVAGQSLRDVQKAIKPMPFAEFKAFAPSRASGMASWPGSACRPWSTRSSRMATRPFATARGWSASEPVAAWKKYLAFHIASDNAAHLPKAFDDASFEFFGKTLRGVQAERDRWKRGVTLLDSNIGEGVGEVYVAKFFPPENKARWTRSSPTCARRSRAA